MKKQLLALLAVAVVASSANAAVTITGEGALGFISEGMNAPYGGTASNTGFVLGNDGKASLFNNSVFISGEIAKDTTFYSELQFGTTAGQFLVNELNVTISGLKLGRFTVPYGYYWPSAAYSSWNKLQRQDQITGVVGSGFFALAPGFETGAMYSGKAGALGYNFYAVQGGGLNSVKTSTAGVKDALGFGTQITYGLGQTAEIGVAYYSNPDDVAPTSYTASTLGLFGKVGLGAVTLWGEYHSGSTAAATSLKTNTIIAEIDFALSKQLSLAGRYTTHDPDTNTSNNGRSAIQAGLEYMVNDNVTYGLEYTVRSNEGTDLADDTSITATSQFKF